MTDTKNLLSEDLLRQVEDAARAQNRPPAELLEDAVRTYLEDRSWVKILGYGHERSEAAGITTEEGVDRAIAEVRAENSRHGRL